MKQEEVAEEKARISKQHKQQITKTGRLKAEGIESHKRIRIHGSCFFHSFLLSIYLFIYLSTSLFDNSGSS